MSLCRLVWSRSLHATADIFLDLKSNQDDPDVATAAAVGLPLGADGNPVGASEVLVNQPAIDVLRKLPGVTESNYRAIMNECACLADLAAIPVERLEQIMGSKKLAGMLRGFLDAPCPRV